MVERARVIPILLSNGRGLVKSKGFATRIYVGDAINAVRIFNDKEVDELILLDIDATRQGRGPDFNMIREIASECFSPLGYGGGVGSLADAERLVQSGVEKIAFNAALHRDPALITATARALGTSSVVVSIDAFKSLTGRWQAYDYRTGHSSGVPLVRAVAKAQDLGAGEILVTDIRREGRREGPDRRLLMEVLSVARVPVVFNGGVRTIEDIRQLLESGASGVAGGAMFVLHGKHEAVLISYPSPADIGSLSLAVRKAAALRVNARG